MANNRTHIPGMDSESIDNLYSRNSGSPLSNGTYIPGMQEDAPGVKQECSQPFMSKTKVSNDEPVLGFLYSISRRGVGEYWPLFLGTNTIGRDSSNRIQLKERTVSTKHAELYVRVMKSTGEIIASIRDCGSKTGMFLNEDELDFENHPIKNGDILTIGANYRLVVILINARALGLTVSEDFQVAEEDMRRDNNDPFPITNNAYTATRRQQRQDDGTIDLSGGQNPFAGGDTNILG